jgi:catechol 2,3-dioxygenase-like lactoylglutathione lyase family enzyme
MKTRRVTGVGGVFFKARNPKALRAWYAKHLGMEPGDGAGISFRWRQDGAKVPEGYTVWSPFAADSDYMKPSRKDFMINLRVENLASLLKALTREGVKVLDRYEEIENGKFGYVLDPDGTLIELWEPSPTDPTIAPPKKPRARPRR